MKFRVIDNQTGKEADPNEIANEEEWADSLVYCDIEGFAILEDGNLILLDECGNYEYCPEGRFTVVFEESKYIKSLKALPPEERERCYLGKWVKGEDHGKADT